MENDTRNRNYVFKTASIHTYLDEYTKTFRDCLATVDRLQIDSALEALKLAHQNGNRVFIAGNGGSSSIADHLECDFQKGCMTHETFQTRSLVTNVPLLTAIANDKNFKDVFSFQLKMMKAKEPDIVILISSSGNSPNIVDAAEFAKDAGCLLIGMTGFDGGRLKELADIKLHVPFANYGLVEDAHQALMHVLAQFVYLSVRR